jgi:DNA-binding protein H-NS
VSQESDFEVTPAQRAAVIHRIRTLMEYWSITPEDLERAPDHKPNGAALPPEVKYCHPVSGDTWDGVGPHPEWLRNALLKEGYTVQQLRDAAAPRDDDAPVAP